MRRFQLRPEYQGAYLVLGGIFLAVSAYLWVELLTTPSPNGAAFWDVATNAAVSVIGVLLLLRPWRSSFGIDDGAAYYADGFLPCRRIALHDIHAVYSNGGKRMILYRKSGKKVHIEYTFEGLGDILSSLADHGVQILDSPRSRADR